MNIFQNYLNNTPKSRKSIAKEDICDYEFRADLFMSELTNEFISNMDDQGIIPSKIADRLEISRAAVSQFLNGNKNITVKTLFKWFDKLGLTLDIPKIVSVSSIVTTPMYSYSLNQQTSTDEECSSENDFVPELSSGRLFPDVPFAQITPIKNKKMSA